jgi:hypothetical protein
LARVEEHKISVIPKKKLLTQPQVAEEYEILRKRNRKEKIARIKAERKFKEIALIQPRFEKINEDYTNQNREHYERIMDD